MSFDLLAALSAQMWSKMAVRFSKGFVEQGGGFARQRVDVEQTHPPRFLSLPPNPAVARRDRQTVLPLLRLRA